LDSFRELVERYQSPIRRYLFRLTGDDQMAQDLAQETFVKAYQGIVKTKSELSFKSWLYRIATNTGYDYLRHKKLVSFLPLDDSALSVRAAPSEGDCDEDKLAVQEALLKVPAERRVCMVLHFIEGMTYGRIGAIVGAGEEAVRKRVARGSEDFKRAFNKTGDDI
jgi:RNA polymerase sigma-70 factor (ECF subfamily)